MTRTIRLAAMLLGTLCVMHISGCDLFVSPEQRVERAREKVAAGDDRAALIELQNAVRSDPQNVDARLMLADISLRLGDAKAAQKELDGALENNASPQQTAELSARIKLALGEFEVLRTALDAGTLELQEPALSTYRGLALIGLRQPQAAIESFRKALQADPNAASARIGLAESLGMTGAFEAGAKEIEQVLASDPKNAVAWLAKGAIALRLGKARDAVAALTEARKYRAGQLDVSQQLGVLVRLTEANLFAGDLAAARAAQGELAQRAPDFIVADLLAARIAMSAQDYAQAANAAQKVVATAPDYVQGRLLLGAASYFQGNFNQAEANLSEVLRRSPENVEARKLLAQTHIRLQRPDLATQVLAPLQQADSTDAEIDALLGWASLQRGEQTAAVQLLERSVAAQPGNAQTRLALAAAYINAGEHEKAIKLLQAMPAQTDSARRRESLLISALAGGRGEQAARAEMDRLVAASPDDVALLNLAAAMYGRDRNYDRARALLTSAIAAETNGTSSLLNLARLELRADNKASARNALQRALGKDKSNQEARVALAQLSVAEGDVAGAIKLLQEIRVADPKAVEPRLALAGLHLRQKETDAAENVVREAIEAASDRAAVLAAVGQLYARAGRYDAALNHFRAAAELNSRDPAPLLDVARVQLALADRAAARSTLERALSLKPDDLSSIGMLSKLDVQENRGADALKRIAALRAERPQDAVVALLEGDVASSMRLYDQAMQAFDVAMRLQPTAAAAVGSYKARIAAGAQNPVAPLQAWVDRNPKDIGARIMLADALSASGATDRALAHYEQLVAVERPSPIVLNNLAWLYFQRGDQRALPTAKRAYEGAPQVPAIADTYGWILVKSGQVKEALEILRQAAGSKPDPEIRYHYAVALAQTGNTAAARRELEAIVEATASGALGAEVRKLLEELRS